MVRIPDPDGDWQEVHTDFKCRDFPKSVSDRCEKENRLFCVEWTSAGYLAQMAVGFGGMALFALLIGVSTHSRRRRVWKAVAGLVTFNGAWPNCLAFNEEYSLTFDLPLIIALFSMIAFIIVTDLYRTSDLPDLAFVHPGEKLLCPPYSFLAVLNLFPS